MPLITGDPAVPQRRVIEDTVVPAHAARSAWLGAGQMLRLIDLERRQAIDFLCFGTAPFEGQVERYHMPKAIKIPKSILIGRARTDAPCGCSVGEPMIGASANPLPAAR